MGVILRPALRLVRAGAVAHHLIASLSNYGSSNVKLLIIYYLVSSVVEYYKLIYN